MTEELSAENRRALDQDIAVDIGRKGESASDMLDDDAWLPVPVGETLLFVLGGSPEGKRLTAKPDRHTVAPDRVSAAVYLSSLPEALIQPVYNKLKEALDK